MNCNNYFYGWFEKLVSLLIKVFLLFSVIATLSVFTSPFSGPLKYILFVVMVAIYLAIVYFFKDAIHSVLQKLICTSNKLSKTRMILIIVLSMIAFRLIYSGLFSFDPTLDGDIKIYYDLALDMINGGQSTSSAISHLYAMACHIAVILKLGIPLTYGIFISILFGTIINFLSFSDIMGKEKTFLAIMLYVISPSTSMLSMCPTHEIFVYLYLSLFIFFLNKTIHTTNVLKVAICSVMTVVSSILVCFINPAGYMAYIILFLVIVLSNITISKKTVVLVILILSLTGTSLISKKLETNKYFTTVNTYTILIHGSNADSLGEQVDGYPRRQMTYYLIENNMEWNPEQYLIAYKGVLVNQYKYLLSNPLVLLHLIAHKVYILYSGSHYSINMGYAYSAYGNIVYYLLLVISTILHLFALTVALAYYDNKKDKLTVSNYKLAILGNVGVTMLCIVVNKYSVYIIPFIYLLSLYQTDLTENLDVYE